ncbi:putative ankyrin repeat protein RF_0381 isoform X2 [Octopus vulgaris]|uniref:Ankyrin repeat protein RF_0381 isoform X2 n=1 Tax=Octopus vulgaris TaxID=6645 RepID=A0AA36FA24_OCTVU|nr:putative ankyrin repeat protein RF_0381 isoform X2 [Octopus vulgaris]
MSSLSSLQINKPIDEYGKTPLMWACDEGIDRRIIEILLEARGEVGAKDIFGNTDLHFAVLRDHLQAVNAQSNDGCTPLHWACDRGYLHTVDLLLGHNGIDANVVNNTGVTPLHVAVQKRNYELVSLLLNQDSVNLEIVNKKYRTPLLEAVSDGHLGIIQRLIARGANVNAIDHGENNCLHLALATKEFHSEVEHITMLDQWSWKLSLKKKDRLCSIIVASYLFEVGANFYQKNMEGKSPLNLIKDGNLKEKLKTFIPPACTYCQVMYASSEFKPCEHIALCRDCYVRIKWESCPTCQQPISGVREFARPIFEDKEVQTVEEPRESPVLKERDLLRVAKRLGRDWWQVAIFLGVDTTKLKIDDESIDTVKQGYLILYEWFKNCDPETRTHATLSAALEEAECFAAMECLSLDAK